MAASKKSSAKKGSNSKKAVKSSSKFTFWIIGLIAVCIIGFIFLANNDSKSDQAAQEIDYSNQPFLG
jgi:preprotein translocase subunit SecG